METKTFTVVVTPKKVALGTLVIGGIVKAFVNLKRRLKIKEATVELQKIVVDVQSEIIDDMSKTLKKKEKEKSKNEKKKTA